jgi:hypothetical protein
MHIAREFVLKSGKFRKDEGRAAGNMARMDRITAMTIDQCSIFSFQSGHGLEHHRRAMRD